MRTNWAGNYSYAASALHTPGTFDELRELVQSAARVKVVGTRHTFNGITDTPGVHISLAKLDRVLAIDAQARTVTVEGGIIYDTLCKQLHAAGFALPNLASLPHISVAGAIATGTHGSGDALGSLATAVEAVELLTGDGELVSLSRADGERFRGAVIHLGALGIVTKLTLAIVPAFGVRQHVYEDLPMAGFGERYDALTRRAYSVSLFTDWRAPRFTQVWLKRVVAGDAEDEAVDQQLHEAMLATAHRHPIATMASDSCTLQMGVAGPWHERLPHFRPEHTPSSGHEIQSEYYVPRRHAAAAIAALQPLIPTIGPLVQASEVRTVAADDLWLSPCRGEPCMAVHITWHDDMSAVRAVVPLVEAALSPFDARPHWGKLFTTDRARLEQLFPMLPAFRSLARELDPRGKLRNAFLDQYVLGEDGRT